MDNEELFKEFDNLYDWNYYQLKNGNYAIEFRKKGEKYTEWKSAKTLQEVFDKAIKFVFALY